VRRVVYLMRAWKTAMPVGYVWWRSPLRPDFFGELSGCAPVDLIDVAVVGEGL
jgi:hypothetical protein